MTSRDTAVWEAQKAATRLGAHPDTINTLPHVHTRADLDRLISRDYRLADMAYDLATSWAVDMPTPAQRARWGLIADNLHTLDQLVPGYETLTRDLQPPNEEGHPDA